MDNRTSTITRISSQRQALPVEQMDATMFLPLCDLSLIIGSTFVLRLDHEIYYCKTIMVCNGYVL